MILLVARRELLGHLRSRRLRALLALVVALLATGAFVNVRRFEERVRYADALESLRTVSAALERDDPESLSSRFGWRSGRVIADPALRAIRPPAPASVLALGADLAAPGFWQFGTEGVSAGPAQDADASVADQRTLDVAFVVRVVLSLVAVLLAAETIAGDRERGLLRALFTAPVSRLDVLCGKYVGGLLTLCVPVCAGTLAAAVVMLLVRAPLLGPGVGLRLLSLAVGAVLFLAAMLALGVLVSARCRDGQTAVVAAVTVWALLVVVLPGGASLVASVARPVTPDELQRQARSEGIRQLEVERARTCSPPCGAACPAPTRCRSTASRLPRCAARTTPYASRSRRS
ncbi:hypothetical protein J421_3880 [Gemmatirosa kalamazoonensis]|uniref:ABC-2 type transporter n=1 Tax=Gemmatirosa kalamazoonensis TaxID=861299 RepID=W0RLT3_9BACT|nr:ABC transporter permease subunit [Gemmatirosa kalamazoonensis]AHG91417.1 hypothetical protein J421_3880 [Gemmatirosa kalamazoonensis]